MSGLRIDVADLLARPAARRNVSLTAPVDDLAATASAVTDPVTVAVTLERIPDGLVVRGTVEARWQGECSYCLRDLDETLVLHVDELFETEPIEGETYPIHGHEIDLEQLVRDTVLLELPLAPACPDACPPDADGRPVAADPRSHPTDPQTDSPNDPPPDPRWAALSDLEIP